MFGRSFEGTAVCLIFRVKLQVLLLLPMTVSSFSLFSSSQIFVRLRKGESSQGDWGISSTGKCDFVHGRPLLLLLRAVGGGNTCDEDISNGYGVKVRSIWPDFVGSLTVSMVQELFFFMFLYRCSVAIIPGPVRTTIGVGYLFPPVRWTCRSLICGSKMFDSIKHHFLQEDERSRRIYSSHPTKLWKTYRYFCNVIYF